MSHTFCRHGLNLYGTIYACRECYEELSQDLAAARALLLEFRDEWIDPSYHMAGHLISRIDAALAGKDAT